MLHNQMTKRQYWLDYEVLKSTQHHKSQQAEADQKKNYYKITIHEMFWISVCFCDGYLLDLLTGVDDASYSTLQRNTI